MKQKLVLIALLTYVYLAQCQSCDSVHGTLQTTLTSPNYPGRYFPNLHCEYVIKSPFSCENEFNVNFMDFSLETSPGCVNDKLVISYTDLDNQDDLDIICGSAIGLKTYKTINGVLNIKFETDGGNQDMGFKINVTRLPCVGINEDATDYTVYNFETTTVEEETTWPPPDLDLIPPQTTNNSDVEDRFLTIQPSSHYYPPGNFYLPPQATYPNYPNNNNYYPGNNNGYYPNNCCDNNNNRPQYPTYPTYPRYPNIPTNRPPYWNQQWPCYPEYPTNLPPTQQPPTYPEIPTTTPYPPIYIPVQYQQVSPRQAVTPQLPVNCCRTIFNQNRFYLTNPGFPSNAQPNGDCIFIISKSNPNVCRLTIRFKFFLLIDQTNQCINNYIEIDGQRICGCRTGLIYESQWGTGDKVIRYRTLVDNSRPIKGFLMEVVQEECPNRYLGRAEKRQYNRPIANLETYYVPHTATVQMNSTSLATYYYYDRPQTNTGGSTNEIDEPLAAEQPRARFFYGTGFLNTRNLCNFGFLEWAIVSVQQLWTNRPICYSAQQYY